MIQTIYDYFVEDNKRFPLVKIDSIQKVLLPFITSPFFPWVCMILLLNSKNWKRPVILILIGHWFMRSIGDSLRNTMEVRTETSTNAYWPYTRTNWYVSNALAHVFWLGGEIMGDWYPLLRTKAVTTDKKKIKLVYITCICYNLTKIFGMYTYFMDYPIDLRVIDEKGNRVRAIVKFNIYWWFTIGVMQIASCMYDLSVIYSLKACLFNKLEEYKNFSKNTFLDKFKQISELRIICSMVISIIFLPFLIFFVVSLIREYHKTIVNGFLALDPGIEQLRQVVLSFNFTLMYIDQILLRSYVNKNNYRSKNTSVHKIPYYNSKPEDSNNNYNYSINIIDSSSSNLYELNKIEDTSISASPLIAPNSAILSSHYSNSNSSSSHNGVNDSNYYLNMLNKSLSNKNNNNNYINITSFE